MPQLFCGFISPSRLFALIDCSLKTLTLSSPVLCCVFLTFRKKLSPFFSPNIASQMSNFYICICIAPYFLYFWKCNLPMNPYVHFCVVGRSIGRSVRKFLKRQESYTSIAPLGEHVFVPYHQQYCSKPTTVVIRDRKIKLTR